MRLCRVTNAAHAFNLHNDNEDDSGRQTTTTSHKMKKSSILLSQSPSLLTLLSTALLSVLIVSQELNLIGSNQYVSATITHHFTTSNNSNHTNIPIPNLNQTTNSQEFLLNLVKNSYKTGANANQNSNNATSYSPSAASSTLSTSSTPSASAQSPAARPPPPSRAAQPMHYQTTYACEGNQLEFGCSEGKMIHLVRAIYGRFSLSICNEQGYSNYSVNCASFKAFLFMETRCNKLNNCSVNVSEELFGDPCQGTSKYLEVQYYCYDANNHHNNQSNQQQQQQQVPNHRTNQLAVPNHLSNFAAVQPQIQQQQPNNNNNNNYSPQVVVAATPSSSSSSNHNNDIAHKSQQPATQSGGGSILGQPKFSLNPVGGGTGEPNSSEPSADSVIANSQEQQHFCPPQTSARNLHWNYTRAGRLAKQDCPTGSIGEVTWLCDADRLRFLPQWSPDFSRCRLSWLERLSQQLDRMLESPSKQQQHQQQQSAPEMTRAQNEQILKLVLTDLTLMVRTNELFSEDLERIDIMVSQILAQFRSLSVVYGSLDSWRSPVFQQGGARNNNFAFLYEDLFKKLVSVVSSLFDGSQRSAWLEIKQSSERQRLEQRLLSHLKEAGVLMANVFGSSLANYQLEPIRQPNVFAGFAVINNNGGLEFPSSSPELSNSLTVNEENNELRVQLRNTQSSNANRPFTNSQLDEEEQQTLNEFRIHTSVLRELTSKGITRLLVIGAKKPNYSLMKQQLESAYATAAAAAQDQLDPSNWLSVLDGSQLWTTRVFGVFAIVGENGDVLDGQQQQTRTVNDLLAQWPISVDFRSPTPQVASVYQPQVARACSALDGHAAGGDDYQQPCKTYKVNATSHICRCNRFGFVSLISYAALQQQQQQQDILLQQQWPTNQLAADSAVVIGGGDQPSSYIGAQGKQQQSVGTWTATFIALGLFLLVVFVTAFLINLFIRASSQSRLNKKPGGFFSAAGGFIGQHHRDLSSGPTTGPLVDHSLVGDPLVAGNNGTTQSGSIIGLTQSAYQGYKTHQQSALYAAHLPPMAGMCRRNRWLRWTHLLNPANWLGSRSKDDQMIQHRVIGSSLSSCKTPGSVSHKSTTYQNGYTTAGLHHSSVVNAGNMLPLAAPSSSTSSYVSSSAYYEEIGPGNLTKVNTNQLNNNARTLVDQFKRAPLDQQQQHQQVMGQQASLWIQQPNSANITSYPLDQSNYGSSMQQHQMSMMPVNGYQLQQSNKQHDLNQLHQQPPSTGSGSSSSSTPRHYLFASPTAVNAYKSSMSQQQQQATTLNHHHHCQQMQFKTNQDHRFMQS